MKRKLEAEETKEILRFLASHARQDAPATGVGQGDAPTGGAVNRQSSLSIKNDHRQPNPNR